MTKQHAADILAAIRRCGSAQFMQYGSGLSPDCLHSAISEGFLRPDQDTGMLTANTSADAYYRLEQLAESTGDDPSEISHPVLSPSRFHDLV